MSASYLRVGYFLLFVFAASEKIVFINQDIGHDAAGCLSSTGIGNKNQTACKSLEFVSSQIGNDCSGLTIVIETPLLLNELIVFSNCSSLNITSANGQDGVVLTSNRTAMLSCGLLFCGVANLALSGVTVRHCGHRPREELIKMNRSVAVHIHQATNLTLRFVSISHISGTGLVLSDMGGSSVIEDSIFMKNSVSTEDVSTNNIFAGGIHMQFDTSEGERTSITIKNCTFDNNCQPNTTSIDPVYPPQHDLQILYGYGTGGGMGILFMGNTQGVNLSLEQCTFTRNEAIAGAGLYVHFQDNATNNTLTVADSSFENNFAYSGGGLSLGIGQLKEEVVTFNSIRVQSTTFTRNKARYGGGVSLFAVHSNFVPNRSEMVQFLDCTWTENEAYYSSAVDVSAFRFDHFNFGFLPVPRFTHCNFTGNQLLHFPLDTKFRNSGAVSVTGFRVEFEGTNLFVKNSYTSLLLTSGTVVLDEGAAMIFDSNEGLRGGAIGMYGFSSLKGKDNCTMVFRNNFANKVGGAIYYQPFDQREFVGAGQSCFIQYIGNTSNPRERNYTFTFSNNSAPLGGTAIFSASFYPCFYSYYGSRDKNNLTSFFDKIGNFHFDDPDNALATEGNWFVLEDGDRTSFSVPPGKLLNIPLAVRDEFKQLKQTPVALEVHHLAEHYDTLFTNNRTRLYGKENEELSLIFNIQNTRDAYYDKITVTLSSCPPGFCYHTGFNSCICCNDNDNTTYQGIVKCDRSSFRAYITREYWVGYHNHTLYTGPCAFKDCHINSIPDYHHLLPAGNSNDNLSLMMCGDAKQGFLCGSCKENYSAYFHSNTHKCGSSELCNFSILFYILSDIVPMVILFTLIIHFNVSFTMGGVSGLVFFSQMIVTTPTDMKKILNKHDSTTIELFNAFQTGYTLIYNVLNFNFFSVDQLSFCLWSSAKPMDVLVIKYATTVFALLLVFVLIRIMNSQWYMRRNKNKKLRSVVHGISAFLVLSFSQCASVCFEILAQNRIKSNRIANPEYILLTQNGGLLYFQSKHLPYAITAIFFLIFFVFIPPLLLLSYPLMLQILALCKLSEHKFTRCFLKAVHIHLLIPFLDSFQSCYKDKLRFFAGLYFFYKLGLLFCRSYTNYLTAQLALFQTFIFVILAVHAIVQPYKQRKHNIIDSCLFFNLGFINGINIYNNYLALHQDNTTQDDNLIIALCTIQMIFSYIPIVGVLFWGVHEIFRRRQRRHYQSLDSFLNVQEDTDR